jgi:conjugative relaxase-like TrwC/TraI family protein
MLSVRVIVSGTPADEQAVADYLFGREGKYFAESAVYTEWYGSLSRRWGLYLNPVDETDFRMFLDGIHPHFGLALPRGAGGRRCPGTDLTFSAPKSVSVLLALGCEEVRAAHRAAVREALAFVEAYCIRYRLKRGGRVLWRQGREALFAVFEHETSRAGDPQLHSHAVLLNVTYDDEHGKYRALRNDEIYRAQLCAGLVYRAALAEALRGFGFEIRITDPEKGLFEVAGVPDAAIEALSTRRAEIRALVERWRAEGRYGAASEAELHEVACLKSRRPKGSVRLNRAAVESVLEALGYDREGVLAATAHAEGDLPPELPPREVLRAALARLGEHSSLWGLAEVFREALRLGLGRLTVREVEGAIWEALREGEVLCLTPDPGSGMVWLTTPDLLEAEREFARLVEMGRDSVRPLLPDPPPPPAGLGKDQAEAYTFILSAPHRVIGIVGLAGTGKSAIVGALVGALREAGYTVAAVAPTGKAAEELRRLGVDADTVDAYLLRHGIQVGPVGDSGVRGADPPPVAEGPDVLIVDESSMLGAVKAAALLKAFAESRVLLVGDPKQLRPVEAGSPFENVVRAGILPHARLTRIIRQTDPAYREAVYAAARDPAAALKVLEGLGAVRRIEGPEDVAEAVWEHGGPEAALAVTPLRERARELNRLIRAEAVRRGLVSGEGQTFEVWERLDSPLQVWPGDLLLASRSRRPMEVLERRAGFIVRTSDGAEWDLRRLSGWQAYRVRTLELAPGDRIVFTRNDRRLGVRNGQVAAVRAVSPDRVVVELDRRDRALAFNPHEFKNFDYAYALTTHKAQGISVNTIICDLPASWVDARQFYVQISRGRRHVVLCTDDPESLMARLGSAEAERLARRAVEAGALVPARMEALDAQGRVFSDVEAAVAAVGALGVWTPDPDAAEGLRKRLPKIRVETDARRLRRYVVYLPAGTNLRDRRVVRGLLRARAVVTDDPEAFRRAVAALPAPDLDAWEGPWRARRQT